MYKCAAADGASPSTTSYLQGCQMDEMHDAFATTLNIQAVHKHVAPALTSTLHHHSQPHCTICSQTNCNITHRHTASLLIKPAQVSDIAKLCCNAGKFAPGVDLDTGRYSVLGSLPQVPSIHSAMHDYHTQSQVGPTPMYLCSHLNTQGLVPVSKGLIL